MALTDFLGLLGGLALFLYGMQMMSDGLEAAAGNRMKQILERLTSNRFFGVLAGAGITAVIQSSSATTVMVVGFVNSGLMTLRQAVWIIMGANIGTTITGQLISLDVGMLAPLFAFLGVAMITFFKIPKVQYIGKILAGLGVLFLGMNMMGDSMAPLENSEAFVSLMTRFSNPILGILAGAVFTAIIQSSSASVGILQTLAKNGLISFPNAVFVLFGQNIGTCITAVLASIGTSRSAKRTTIIHLLFNIIGTCVFTVLCLTLPVTDWIGGITPNKPAAQIANMHTTFNIVTTLLLLPLGTQLAALATRILPDSQTEKKPASPLALPEENTSARNFLGSSSVRKDLLHQEIQRMIGFAKDNVDRCYQAILDSDDSVYSAIVATEDKIDAMNREISQYISRILVNNKSGNSVAAIEEYFLITGNTERIGDHALNIGGYVDIIRRTGLSFSDTARQEIEDMRAIAVKALDKVLTREDDLPRWLSHIAAMEQKMDDMTASYRENHLERMRNGLCSAEACILYSEMLTDFERIGDHVLNIAQAFTKIYHS